MKKSVTFLFTSILVFFTGCSTPDYHAYTNPKQIFPGTSGSFVQIMKNGIPIYTDNVDRPYFILGEVDLADNDPHGLSRTLSKIVKLHKGDAGIIRNSRIFNIETKSGQLFIFPNGSGFSTANKTIYHYTATGYVVAFKDLLDLELANLQNMVSWFISNTNGGVFNGVSYSPEQINTAQYAIATNFPVWIQWCDGHPTGGTFTDNQGESVVVPAKKIPAVRLELQKEAGELEAIFKNSSHSP